ncbi:inactive histone-lysine N-methyltransferase 2E [Stomoxys calcitrans]|uniref:inactive histone-lysine N-methyltransferase 2E n=1 Tax=Stomoxys calcitrans TaxID=35570 RepID=UPI0027E244A4|nr:inactive histone-lysine N-methyltransferase 2E [Stomoxys calcitrans]XP_059224953.1 inactive histone-lysine N-methyltransferase 2E [Stomoxys calcitrans]XP_059224954.1 inactive histone-lysine N-methyltransferase 2E [Stomoxys calcitrans]XP_059224955.1 inactive histone-lysine N-methyltransferase 2E [Stomoxys calcitrans]
MQYSSRSDNYSSSLRDSPPKWTSGKEQKAGYAYKSSYQYSTTGSGSGSYQDKPVDKNIDQLDALLEDLKNEREVTRDRDHSMNYRTIERSTNEDPLSGTVTKTTRVIKTTKNLGGGHDDSDIYPTSDYSTLRSNGTLVRNDYQTLEKPYAPGSLSPGGGFYETKHHTKVYESNRSLNKQPEFVPTANSTTVATTTTNATHLEEDLKNITLNDDILPVPGTKVTTTVRTYTYEIPANAPLPTSNTLSRKIHYNTVQTNETNNLVQPHPVHAIPPTVVYNTESYSTLNKGHDKPSPSPAVTNLNYEVREHYETNTMRNNTLPLHPRNQHPGQPGEPTNTIVYNIHNTTTTTNTERPGYPPHSPKSPTVTYVSGPHSPAPHGPHHGPHHGPPHGPTTHHYIYKESTNTVNTIHGPGGPPNEPMLTPKNNTPNTLNRPTGGYPPNGSPGYPPNGGTPVYPANGHPPNSTITYNYSSTTTNNRRGPDYGSPSSPLPPAPFPVDGVEYPVGNGNPPQRVDELMQSFGHPDAVDRPDLNTPRKREIETAVASPNQQQIPSVNRAGRDIYYPPGHEMMLTKRQEMHASGSQAGGRWAKGSGMYEYESGSRSKTTTKSGGAMVPVCLPLCCAMPCSIM